VWEKEIPQGVKDFVFLDENGYNVFSSQYKNPEKALKELKMLLATEGKVRLVEGDNFKVIKEMTLLPHSQVAVSKNGRNFVVIEHIISDTIPEAKLQWCLGVIRTTVRLFNWKLEELARIDYGGPYTEIFALGNDRTVILTDAGEDGTYTTIIILTREGNTFKRSFSIGNGIYRPVFLIMPKMGRLFFLFIRLIQYLVKGKSHVGERIVVDSEGREIIRYNYQHPGWAGWVSPNGNYLVEVARGASV